MSMTCAPAAYAVPEPAGRLELCAFLGVVSEPWQFSVSKLFLPAGNGPLAVIKEEDENRSKYR